MAVQSFDRGRVLARISGPFQWGAFDFRTRGGASLPGSDFARNRAPLWHPRSSHHGSIGERESDRGAALSGGDSYLCPNGARCRGPFESSSRAAPGTGAPAPRGAGGGKTPRRRDQPFAGVGTVATSALEVVVSDRVSIGEAGNFGPRRSGVRLASAQCRGLRRLPGFRTAGDRPVRPRPPSLEIRRASTAVCVPSEGGAGKGADWDCVH